MDKNDYLDRYAENLPIDRIRLLQVERRNSLLNIDNWNSYRTLAAGLPSFQEKLDLSIERGTITIGSANSLQESEKELLLTALKTLIPWRKGPLNFFGIEIEAEWRSDLKWDRITPHLDPIRNRRVLDIGCNNGYYLFRMAEHSPELALGIDPVDKYYFQFQLMQKYLKNEALAFEVFGIEDVDLYPDFFHTILCMGIIYHCRAPLVALQKVHQALAPDGQLILESLAIPGDDPVSLSPPDRYGKMRNAWFIPTASCMAAWLKLTGFVDIEVVSSLKLTADEQRKTEFAPWESLSDYLDPGDPTKTVEGYPAPLRVAVIARKKA